MSTLLENLSAHHQEAASTRACWHASAMAPVAVVVDQLTGGTAEDAHQKPTQLPLLPRLSKLCSTTASGWRLYDCFLLAHGESRVRCAARTFAEAHTRAGAAAPLTLPNFTRRRRWRGRPCPRSWRPARTSLLRTSARTSSSARTLNTGARRRRSCARASKRRAPPTGRQTTRASQSAAAKGSPALRARGPCHANAGKSRGD